MAVTAEEKSIRLDLNRLWDFDSETIEQKHVREKNEMLSVIIKKTEEIKVDKH